MRVTDTMARAGLVAVAAVAMLAACSGSVNTTPAPGFPGFSTATTSVCVQPSTSSQVVSIPSTGGASAQISFGAYVAGAAGCDEVTLSAGADVETPQSSARLAQVAAPESACMTSRPLLTISIGEAEGNTTIFEYTTVVTGMQIFAPGLPNGIYPVLLMPIGANPVLQFSANNGVLTLLPSMGPKGEPLQPVILPASSGSVFAIYPMGSIPIVCVTPTPSPSPMPSGPTATPSTSPSPTVFATAMPIPGAVGEPPPAYGAIIGTYSFMDPSTVSCQPGQLLCNGTNVPISQGEGGILDIPVNFSGTITFSANIAYMGIYPPVTNTCASDWTVAAGIDGSGSISIPSSDALGATPNQPACVISYTTLPPGNQNNNGYSEEMVVIPVDGVPCSYVNGMSACGAARRRR